MKKTGVLNIQLSQTIAALGHGDMLVIADAGLPIPKGVPCIDLAVALGVPTWAILASYVAVTGVFVLPTYPTSLAAMEFDTTGTTRVGKYVLNHPFMLPGLGGIIAGVAFGFIIAPMIA